MPLSSIEEFDLRLLLTILVLTSCGLAACSKTKAPQTPEPQPPTGSLALPVTLDHWTGDLDAMIKRRQIRALVVYSRSSFFYDKGHPRGIAYEALEEFQRFLNKKLKSGSLKVQVIFL